AHIDKCKLLQATTVHTGITCYDGSMALATVHATGGHPPYSYLWSESTTDTIAAGLTAGDYTVTVTDDRGCTNVQSVSIAPEQHSSARSAVSINPDSIYKDFTSNDTVFWFKFIADTNELLVRIMKPFNPAGTSYANWQTASLYSGNGESNMVLL